MDKSKTNEFCLHCSVRLRASSRSQMCRRCRLHGHKEFGACDKCSKISKDHYFEKNISFISEIR